MKLNKFEIRSREHTAVFKNSPVHIRLWDFFIDGESLADQLGVGSLDAATSLEYKNSDWVLQEFFGQITPSNQFGTGRLVLYRCHCGCDYCGVISCEIRQTGNIFEWNEIRSEDDFEMGDLCIPSLRFDADQYREAITQTEGLPIV